MKVTIKNVTPAMAKEFLTLNKKNRAVNKTQLNMIVRSILAGDWKTTHQGIAFYESGELADGQHRLEAICKTGVTITMPVFTGVKSDDKTVLAIDCGKARSLTDSSAISGVKITQQDLAVAKGVMYGYEEKFKKFTHSESRELCENMKESINIAKRLFPKHKRRISIAPVKCGIVKAVLSGVPEGLAYEFCKTLATGEYDSEIMINAVKLRNKLITSNFNGGSDRAIAFEMAKDALVKTSQGIKIKRLFGIRARNNNQSHTNE